jgi:hypothetical protein
MLILYAVASRKVRNRERIVGFDAVASPKIGC